MTVDLLLWVNRVNNGYFINFEANTYMSESLDLKNTYYTYRLILNRQEIGKTYNPVKVYQINLDLLPLSFNKNIINVFTMTDPETKEVLPGTPQIIHVALDKYEKDPYNKNISDGEWALEIFLCESIKEARKLAGDNPILKDVFSYMEKYSSNIDNLKFLDQQAEFMKVFETDKLKAKEDGLKIGIDKGKLEMAKNLVSAGVDINLIAKTSGLSVKEIEKLK